MRGTRPERVRTLAQVEFQSSQYPAPASCLAQRLCDFRFLLFYKSPEANRRFAALYWMDI